MARPDGSDDRSGGPDDRSGGPDDRSGGPDDRSARRARDGGSDGSTPDDGVPGDAGRRERPASDWPSTPDVRATGATDRAVPTSTRRALLAGGAGATLGLAGCLSRLPGLGASDGGGDALTVERLAVGDQSGGPVAVHRPGEVALLDFWATWCAPCKPQLRELRTVHEGRPDLHLVSITNESDEAAIRAYWQRHGGPWPVASDPTLATNDRYGVTRIPTLLVLGQAGSVEWRHSGLASASSVEAAVAAASDDAGGGSA